MSIFMYKYTQSMLPKSFDGMFTCLKDIHHYNTRHRDNYQLHKSSTTVSNGLRIWNQIPSDIKHVNNIGLFKREVLSLLRGIKI
jgi:hypothetical protein